MFERLDTAAMAQEILRLAQQRQLSPGPWSLCELRLGTREVERLQRWAAQLQPAEIDLAPTLVAYEVGRYPRSARFGLVFGLFCTEMGRRQAFEGLIWPVIAEGHFSPAVSRVLFRDGQPVPLVRSAVEAAFVSFGLRNVFGQSGYQMWLDSIFLQFGFTRRGLKRLPWWLDAARPPQAIQTLLTDKAKMSNSFIETWAVLKALRAANLRVEDAREQLKDSPWLLEADLHEALSCAVSREGCADEVLSPTLFSSPILRWTEKGPSFELRVVGAALFDLTDDAYDVRLDDLLLTRLLRQSDGSYTPYSELTLPLDQAQPTLKLCSRQGQVVATESVELWPSSEELVVYTLHDGRRVKDPHNQPLNPEVEHALLLTQDLEIVPAAPREWVEAGGGEWRLYRLVPPPEIAVHLAGEFFWSPTFPDVPPAWAGEVKLTWMREGLGVRLEIWHPSEVQVKRVYVNRQSPRLERRNSETTISDPVEVRGRFLARRMTVTLELLRGEERGRLRTPLELDLVRLLRRDGPRATEVDPREPVCLEDLGEVRIYPPTHWAGTRIAEWCVLEGDVWVSRPTSAWVTLRELRGWGAPLALRTKPYNAREQDLVLLHEPRWSGAVRDARVSEGRVYFTLRESVAVGRQHRVVVWTRDGAIVDDLPRDDWSVAVSDDVVAAAVSFEGTNVGVWVSADWARELSNLAQTQPEDALWLMSWMRLPLLTPRHVREVSRIARRHAASFLETWASHELDEADLAVPRACFARWQPSLEEAVEVLETVGASQGEAHAFEALMRIDPALALRVIKATGANKNQLVAKVLGLNAAHQAQALTLDLGALAATSMRLSANYLEKLARDMVELQVRVGSQEYRDSRLAITHEPFRRYVVSVYLALEVKRMSASR